MATIPVSDELYAAILNTVKEGHFVEQPTAEDAGCLVVSLLAPYFGGAVAAGPSTDGLTGAGSGWSLGTNINVKLSTGAENSRYRERFLCVDIHRFQRYVDHNGFAEGDRVIRAVAQELKRHYMPSSVFRFGGDEFVVVLGDQRQWMPRIQEVTLKYSVVTVDLRRKRERTHHLAKWVAHHLVAGVLSARAQGNEIHCGEPAWMES